MRVLVTGANGFIGKHVVDALCRRGDSVDSADVETSEDQLKEWAKSAEAIVHLAGANRPPDEREFARVNRDLTEQLSNWAGEGGRCPSIIFSSSTQAEFDNPYGTSKRQAEEVLEKFAKLGLGATTVFRLPNVFGHGCRPNYNSVIATFAHNVATGLPSAMNDPKKEITFVYVHDVVSAFLQALDEPILPRTVVWKSVEPMYRRTLGKVLDELESFRDMRASLRVPDFSDRFLVSLYATYLSYLPPDHFSYPLQKREDERGSLAEFIKSDHFGQVFVSRTRPGVTRGNHFHNTKTEKFLVLEGRAVVRFRHVASEVVLEYPVAGEEYRVVDIPPGYTHSIENVGASELVTLFWASEIFNPELPDTIFEAVQV